jgi:hypothetical protein
MHDKFRAAALCSQLEARSLDITVRQTESFADLSQTEAGDHGFLRG